MRNLQCTRCLDTVEVIELPAQFIDPKLYVCGQCLKPIQQLELPPDQRRETRQHDPSIAEIPF